MPSLDLFQEHYIPLDMMLNLSQTPLSYISPGKYKFDFKGSTTVRIKGVEDKRQITATFTVSASGSFLNIQLMYNCKSTSNLPRYDIPNCSDVTIIPNHWSNIDKCTSLLERIIFPILKR